MSENPFADTFIGREIDGYRIEELLGKGGMARVYRALDLKLKRHVAIKVINPQVRNPQNYQARFDKEARSVASLKHPNIVTVYRYNNINDFYFMAMDFIDGADLAWMLNDYAGSGDLMDFETVAKIMKQMTSALDYAHRNGVIHRDVKPSNIMIDREGNAILTDFGLALIADEGTFGEVFGSPHYMSPEQAINSATVVPASDLYSLGVVLYEMLTGEIPFNEGSALDIARAHVDSVPPDPMSLRPDLPNAFIPVLKKALAKKAKERYATGAELYEAIDKAIKKASYRPTLRERQSRPAKRIAERVKPIPVPADVPTNISPQQRQRGRGNKDYTPAFPDVWKDKRPVPHPDHTPQKQRRARPVVMLFSALILVGVIAVAMLPQVRDLIGNFAQAQLPQSHSMATVSGIVTDVRDNVIIFYDDIMLELNRDTEALAEIEVGQFYTLRGNVQETSTGLRVLDVIE